MKKVFFILLIFILIIFSCSLNNPEKGTVSIMATDSPDLTTKDGETFEMQLGIEDIALGYTNENGDTIWESLLEDPDTVQLALKSSEKCNIGKDTIKVKDYSHSFEFFRMIITNPKITMNDSINIPISDNMDSIQVFFAFDSEIDLENGHVDISIDFHSDSWCNMTNIYSFINIDDMTSSFTCSIDE